MDNVDYKQKIFANLNIMQRVLENYENRDLLELRFLSKKVAYEVFPRSFKDLNYILPDQDEEEADYTFHTLLKYAKTVNI